MPSSKNTKKLKYYEAIGRRKTASARVRLYSTKKNQDNSEYDDLAQYLTSFRVSVKKQGGGVMAQKQAVQLGIARALIKFNQDLKPALRVAGFLTRDPRKKERKKPGLKKARKSPQWSKR